MKGIRDSEDLFFLGKGKWSQLARKPDFRTFKIDFRGWKGDIRPGERVPLGTQSKRNDDCEQKWQSARERSHVHA
jgi:hypothetical protein